MREGLARLMGGALGPEDQSVSVCVYVREIMRERERESNPAELQYP